MQKNFKSAVLPLISLILIICRFISIQFVPDVYCDEQDILNHIQSIIATGYDANGNHLPLFPIVGAGRATYTYLYPMVFFLSIFGVTAVSARFVQQILTIVACLLTAYSVKMWTNKKDIFWLTFITSLTLPWGFVQANRIWDPSFVPFYFGIYFFFFTLSMKKSSSNTSQSIYATIAFSSLVLLATVYPPARIPAVAIWMYSFIWFIKDKRIKVPQILIIFITSTILALPLAFNLLNPDFNSRTVDLLVFGQDIGLYHQLLSFADNFVELFDPIFLFVTGDTNYRHSLPIFGMLGTLSFIPLACLFRSEKYTPLTKYMFFSIVTTYLSVALTRGQQPHSLRSCLAWLPFTILIATGWSKFLEFRSKRVRIICYALMAIQFIVYFIAYILYYNHIAPYII